MHQCEQAGELESQIHSPTHKPAPGVSNLPTFQRGSFIALDSGIISGT